MMTTFLYETLRFRFNFIEGEFASNKNIGLGDKYKLYFYDDNGDEKRITIRGRNDFELKNSLLETIEKHPELFDENDGGLIALKQGLKELTDRHDRLRVMFNANLGCFIKYNVYDDKGKFYHSFTSFPEAKSVANALSYNRKKQATLKVVAWEKIFVDKDKTLNDTEKLLVKNFNDKVNKEIQAFYDKEKGRTVITKGDKWFYKEIMKSNDKIATKEKDKDELVR